jgi:ABC-2 type transport system permease protein
VTAVAAVAAYLGNTLARQVDALSWLEPLSPFRYYSGGEPLRNGFQAGDAAILAVISLVLVTIGAFAFSRRDVAV